MINIDLGVEALSPQLTGIGRYTFELMAGLRSHADVAQFRAVYQNKVLADPECLVRGEGIPKARGWRKVKVIADRITSAVPRGRHLYHGPNFMLPEGVEGIITVHDLSVLKFPDTHPPERIAHFEKCLPGSLARARHILTDTECGKQELVDFYGISADRISAIHLGVNTAYHPTASHHPVEILPNGLHSNQYILIVATFEPRKRIEMALQAHAILPDHVKTRHPLVLFCAKGWKNTALHDAIEREKARGFVHILGFVPESNLPTLYRHARLFLFPSIYEGFGLPPIEAMASGVPTIVANRSCLPEVTQDAAMLIDPDDTESFSEAVIKGLQDEAWRAEARERGLGVAASYSWEKCVQETVDVYQRFY